MNVTDLITQVNYRRRDTTNNFISEQEIIDYCNQGLRKVQAENEWDWSKVSTSFSFTDGSTQYAISSVASDLKMPIDVFYTNSYQFELVSPEQFRMLSSIGTYNIYAIDGIYFLCDTSFGSASLQFHYYSTGTALTSAGSVSARLSASTDTPLMPERFQDILVDYAASLAYQKEGMLDDYKVAYESYLIGLQKMKREFPSRRKKILSRMKHINEMFANQRVFDRKENPLG